MKYLKELKDIENIVANSHELVSFQQLGSIAYKNQSWPLYGIVIGNPDPEVPTLGLFGGVHGLEKIGSHVVISYLKSIINQLDWDADLRHGLSKSRIVSIPIINPVGMAYLSRANGNGVDLMRNCPVEMEENVKTVSIASGHRISNKLPWYRGKAGEEVEEEIAIVKEFAERYIFSSKYTLSIDFHSGFGIKDRLWYPYAKKTGGFPRQNQVDNLTSLFNETIPHHIYKIEPQSASYNIAGDLWDYLFDLQYSDEKFKNNIYIPWTLEMGSWIWVKKNPFQLFSKEGIFNPVKEHRFNRAMRRHFLLIDFFFKAIKNPKSWN